MKRKSVGVVVFFLRVGWVNLLLRGCLIFSIFINWNVGRLLSCWGIVTHRPVVEGKKEILIKGGGNEHLNPRIYFVLFFWDIHQQQLRSGRRRIHFSTGRSCWFLTRMESENLSPSPDPDTAADVRSEEAASIFFFLLLLRSDGAPAAWLNAVTPTFAALPRRPSFWTLPRLTSQRTDKWIDRVKMAEEVQPQAWKWLTFPPPHHHPPPPPTSKSNWVE